MLLRRRLKTDDWEMRAKKVLSNFGYRYPDEIDMYDICWRYGIRILPLDSPFINDLFDYESTCNLKAFSIPKGEGRRGNIFIKEGLGPIEKKLILAEEFCHMYSHYSSQLLIDKYLIGKTENQAMRMAAYLLMPSLFMNDVYDAASDQAVLISDIADYFVVTDEFASYRLGLAFNRRVDAVSTLRGKLATLEWF